MELGPRAAEVGPYPFMANWPDQDKENTWNREPEVNSFPSSVITWATKKRGLARRALMPAEVGLVPWAAYAGVRIS